MKKLFRINISNIRSSLIDIVDSTQDRISGFFLTPCSSGVLFLFSMRVTLNEEEEEEGWWRNHGLGDG